MNEKKIGRKRLDSNLQRFPLQRKSDPDRVKIRLMVRRLSARRSQQAQDRQPHNGDDGGQRWNCDAASLPAVIALTWPAESALR
jgi:hypothetical protein